jgi:cytoskeletal protein RodZ
MMSYGYGSMMGGAGVGLITWLVILADLVLLGVWLWKQIEKR